MCRPICGPGADPISPKKKAAASQAYLYKWGRSSQNVVAALHAEDVETTEEDYRSAEG
jgi:hypothetical protein